MREKEKMQAVVEAGQGDAGFFSSPVSRTARPAKTEAMRKLLEKLPSSSARKPATAGPAIWPMAKIKVMKPKTLAVFRGPT